MAIKGVAQARSWELMPPEKRSSIGACWMPVLSRKSEMTMFGIMLAWSQERGTELRGVARGETAAASGGEGEVVSEGAGWAWVVTAGEAREE